MTDRPGCRIVDEDGVPVLRLEGDWRLDDVQRLDAALAGVGLRERPPQRLDGSALATIDTAAALLLMHRFTLAGIDVGAIALDGFAPSHRRIVELVRERLDDIESPPLPRRLIALARVGAITSAFVHLLAGHLAFFGMTIVELGRLVLRPSTLRAQELFAQFRQVCVNAIPVVSLVTFLIGTIVAYVLGQQATQYGANIFVVDGVALGMMREFSPLIVATIVAGRSGAAFTAQLGTMRLTEEIDAIRVLGLSPERVLVMPRVLALTISLPLLVFVGDAAGFSGAMVVADLMLGIKPIAFLERVQVALDVRHFVIGLVKAPVFALFVAVIGCRMGIDVSRDTRSIGVNTTSTVVQSIVVVILLDAIFAVLLQELDL